MKTSQRFSIAAAAVAPALAQGIDYAKTEILTENLAPNVYALTGSAGVDPGHPEAAGGRIGFLAGPDGILMVDAQYAPLTDKVVAAVRKVSAAPIRFLVDTHEHPDHTGGNPNFAKMGALIFAREEAREALTHPLPAAVGIAASGTDPARLPTVTYGMGAPVKIRMGDETVDLIALPPAHTDGDTIVRFENADVIMIGDFYRNYGYPFVDAGHGGSFKGVLQAINLVVGLAGPNTKLVPGHGTIIGKDDLIPYRDMIVSVEAKIQTMLDAGKSLPEVLAAKVTMPYDTKVPGSLTPLPAGLGNSADRFVSAVYGELKASNGH